MNYDPVLGKIIVSSDPVETPPVYASTILFERRSVLSCVALVNQTATVVNAIYPNSIGGRSKPYVDAITLADGAAGQSVRIAAQKGVRYATERPSLVGTDLFLGINGYVTHIAPTLEDGAKWYVKLGRTINQNEFVFRSAGTDISTNNAGPWRSGTTSYRYYDGIFNQRYASIDLLYSRC